MREILFRGKRDDNLEWIEGYIYRITENQEMPFLMMKDYHGCSYQVYPDTVGQYTGLTDKNGKKIFEGDVVAQPVCKYTVEFDGGAFFLIPIPKHNPYDCPYQLIGFGAMFEVIGNIHDNPELIGGNKDAAD